MIVNDNQIISKVKHEDIIIENEGSLKITGIVNGNINVNNYGTLLITGMVNGNISINDSAEVIIRGTFKGNIINKSKLKIHGILNGEIIDIEGGESIIENGALINGIKH